MLKQVLEIYELLDSAHVTGAKVADLLRSRGIADVTVTTVEGRNGSTDFVKAVIPGGPGPTLGVIGRLGGIGARSERLGLVSDADGAVAALAVALKLADMRAAGDELPGTVIVATHICPDAPTRPHHPVAFMGSPVDTAAMNRYEVDPRMAAILSIDTTKGNRICNHKGIAISPTVKAGWILKVADALLDIYSWTAGRSPVVLPITMQDITPYGNDVFHLNSILQPCTVTPAPVVGVAITAESAVPGCATGASHATDIELAARFCVEVAKAFTAGACPFYDVDEVAHLERLYGPMTRLQTLGEGGTDN
ncbi:MAG: hypothetical protein JWN15_2632, partial [Firmicutes bacterium]|nr:hypothetical protein [Bacillota bacterium]